MVLNKKSLAVLALLLCAAVLLCCFGPAGAADYSVTFISVNDMLLDLSWMPYTSGGVIYVPYIVFTDYGLGIHYSYFSPPATAMLYDSSHTVIFEISSGKTYDLNDQVYSSSAIIRNGTVYLPLDFMCSYFGLSYSYITGSEWGNIVRVKNANVVLQDNDFQRAASSLMETRYKNYAAAQNAAKTKATPTPASTVKVTPVPTASKAPDKKGYSLRLAIAGLPSEEVLSILKDKKYTTCFYLTADDILSNPDMVRGILCSGHKIGVLVQDDPVREYEAFCDALKNTAHVKSVLCTCISGNVTEEQMEEKGLVCFSPELTAGGDSSVALSSASSVLETKENCESILLCSPAESLSSFSSFLNYLSTEKYTPRAPLETD